MNPTQLRTFLLLLAVVLVPTTAWSGQNAPATPATGSNANLLKDATVDPAAKDRVADERLPVIVNDEDLPAFLRTDPCDTGDS